MALTYSEMLELGTKIPQFQLINTIDNKEFNINSLDNNKAKLIMFICNHCPYVIHYHQQIMAIANKYSSVIEIVAISSNDAVSHPEDGPEKMQQLAQELNFNFPYLYDESQEIAKKFKAVCTPEFYLFDNNNLLIYRGRLDDSSLTSNKEITGKDLRNAIDNFLSGNEILLKQYPSMGCNIKWK